MKPWIIKDVDIKRGQWKTIRRGNAVTIFFINLWDIFFFNLWNQGNLIYLERVAIIVFIGFKR